MSMCATQASLYVVLVYQAEAVNHFFQCCKTHYVFVVIICDFYQNNW
jgi:hypothetical protein